MAMGEAVRLGVLNQILRIRKIARQHFENKMSSQAKLDYLRPVRLQ